MNRAVQLGWIASTVFLASCADEANPNRIVGNLASDRIELTAEAQEPIVEILVAEGEAVEKGQAVGASGETGLAGGDHLHFTMLLQGLAVTPREWWDEHWIQDRLVLKLGDSLPFESRR